MSEELQHYKRLFAVAEEDIAIRGYLSYVKIIRQQVDYLNSFKIAATIGEKKADSAAFERAQSMWEKLPDMITKMNNLKSELEVEFKDLLNKAEEEEDATPETMAGKPAV
jgi:hypothetical protein